MKKLLLIALVALGAQSCIITKHSNMGFVKNRHIDKDAEVFSVSTSIFLAKPFLKNALQDEEESEALKQLVASVRGIKVLTIDNQKDHTKMNAHLNKYLDRKNYQEWLSIQSDGDHVTISAKQNKKEEIKRIILAVNSDDGETVFVRVKGKIDLNAMTKQMETMSTGDFKLKTKKGTEVAQY